jgi:hypothetical protein
MKANKVATGSELMRVASGIDLAEMIDSNTALAVAEATKDWQDKYFAACDKITKLESDAESRTSYYERKLFECEEHRSVKEEELELCKAHNLMLSNLFTEDSKCSCSICDSCDAKIVATLTATKETIEASRNEIVQKAKSEQQARIEQLEAGLRYYADGNHFMPVDESQWESVSGEPENLLCDDQGLATVEDGWTAKQCLELSTADWGVLISKGES